jgi:hypothetical protein
MLGSIWQDEAQRRLFFEQFAMVNGFDHTNRTNWYNLPRPKLKAAKVNVKSLNCRQNHKLIVQ